MNHHSSKLNDGFYELMQTQQLHELPTMLETSIMKKIEAKKVVKPNYFLVKSIVILGLLSSLYVLVALMIAYYFPYSIGLNNFKNLIFVGIFVYIIYEINEAMPKILSSNIFSKKLTT